MHSRARPEKDLRLYVSYNKICETTRSTFQTENATKLAERLLNYVYSHYVRVVSIDQYDQIISFAISKTI